MLNNCHFSRLIHEQAMRYGEKTALRYRDYDLGRWIPISWTEFSRKVSAVSRALLALGTSVQENLAVFSQNKPESLMVDFGAYGVRAVTIPFYATSSSAQVQYMVNDAEVRLLFVGEQQQYDTARRVLPVCPTLERLIIFDRRVARHEAGFWPWLTRPTSPRRTSARPRRALTSWPTYSTPAAPRARAKA